MALAILGARRGKEHPGYLNWDIPEHRARLLRGEIPSAPRLVVLDEVHKYPRWRGLLKGFFDRYYPGRRFLRDTDGRELDFVVLKDGRPELAVECKTGEGRISRHARYFRARTSIPRFFQVHLGDRDYGDAGADVRVMPFVRFVTELGMP